MSVHILDANSGNHVSTVAMRTILLIVAVLALFTLAVGGVSAHDSDNDADRMNEMMDRCMEMMGQMGEMMDSDGMMNGSDSRNGDESGDSTSTGTDTQNGGEHDGHSDQAGRSCC